MTIDSREPKPDLDAQIRAAEQRVIAADRDWQVHSHALGTTVRGHAGRAATWGGLGVAATLAGGLLLRWRLSARSRARDQLLNKALSAVRWPGTKARAATEAAKAAKASPVIKSTALMSVLATVATLLGAAARTGLKLPAKPGVSSLVMSVLVPMATKWWRARASAPPPLPAAVPAPVAVRPAPPGSRDF